jgi:hypothetical protein
MSFDLLGDFGHREGGIGEFRAASLPELHL